MNAFFRPGLRCVIAIVLIPLIASAATKGQIGLLAAFESQGKTDTRVDRLPALYVPHGQ